MKELKRAIIFSASDRVYKKYKSFEVSKTYKGLFTSSSWRISNVPNSKLKLNEKNYDELSESFLRSKFETKNALSH